MLLIGFAIDQTPVFVKTELVSVPSLVIHLVVSVIQAGLVLFWHEKYSKQNEGQVTVTTYFER